MKCEECLPLIEEYVDGELGGRVAERLGVHLATCEACAAELAAVRREQEVYASYRRDLEVTPAHWNIVRARIEQEKDAAAAPPEARAPRPARLGRLFGGNLRPAFVTAVVLVLVAAAAALVYLRSRGPQGQLASRPATQKQEQTPAVVKQQPTPEGRDASNGGAGVHDEPAGTGGGQQGAPLVAGGGAGAAPKRKGAAAARVPGAGNTTAQRQTPDGSAQFEEAAAVSVPTGARPRAPEAAGEFDFEIVRHAGRAELLLRSFRNVRPATAAAARRLDVSFEKEQARKLLYRNIALRRAADERGDPSAAEILNALEPILLDIANLPGRVRPRDLQSIERRMEKKEIVAALQVRTLLASN